MLVFAISTTILLALFIIGFGIFLFQYGKSKKNILLKRTGVSLCIIAFVVGIVSGYFYSKDRTYSILSTMAYKSYFSGSNTNNSTNAVADLILKYITTK